MAQHGICCHLNELGLKRLLAFILGFLMFQVISWELCVCSEFLFRFMSIRMIQVGRGLCRPSSPTSSLKGQLEKLDYVAWALSTQILQSPKGVSTAFLSACFSALLSVKNFLMSDQILPTTACHSCILSSVHLCGVCLLCITSLPVVEGCSQCPCLPSTDKISHVFSAHFMSHAPQPSVALWTLCSLRILILGSLKPIAPCNTVILLVYMGCCLPGPFPRSCSLSVWSLTQAGA